MIGVRIPTPDGPADPAPPPPVDLPTAPNLAPPFRRRRRSTIAAGAALIGSLVVAGLVGRQLSESIDFEATGYAESFVMAFLSAGEESAAALGPFLGYTPSLDGMRAGDFFVSHLTTDGVTTNGDGTIVSVRAHVLERTEAGYGPAGPLRLVVRLIRTESGFRAAGLPQPAPPEPAPHAQPSRENSLPDTGAEAVAGYLRWYLTGTVPINGIRPAGGYTDVELVSLEETADGALAGVVARTASGHDVRLDLEVVQRSGGWTISRESS